MGLYYEYASLHIALSLYVSIESLKRKFPGEFIYNLSHSLDRQWTIWSEKKQPKTWPHACLHKTFTE